MPELSEIAIFTQNGYRWTGQNWLALLWIVAWGYQATLRGKVQPHTINLDFTTYIPQSSWQHSAMLHVSLVT